MIINNKYQVNILLDDGAITSNIISLDIIKRIGIKVLIETQRRYFITNGESDQILGLIQDIIIGIQGRNIKIFIIIYNHDILPLLEYKTLKKLKILINWEKYD
jgi:predicted aspartyl protease